MAALTIPGSIQATSEIAGEKIWSQRPLNTVQAVRSWHEDRTIDPQDQTERSNRSPALLDDDTASSNLQISTDFNGGPVAPGWQIAPISPERSHAGEHTAIAPCGSTIRQSAEHAESRQLTTTSPPLSHGEPPVYPSIYADNDIAHEQREATISPIHQSTSSSVQAPEMAWGSRSRPPQASPPARPSDAVIPKHLFW